MLKKITQFAFVIGSLASLTACDSSASEPDPIVGTWYGPASYFVVEPDGPNEYLITAHTSAPGFGWSEGEWTAVTKNNRYLVDGSFYVETFRINSETDVLTTEYYGDHVSFNEARNLIGSQRVRALVSAPDALQNFLDAHADMVAN